jgi:hypothetical protein
LVFYAYIKEMHGSRSKIPRKISSGSVAWMDLILALKDLKETYVGYLLI